MKIKLPKIVNGTQKEFAHLCELGGGQKGAPVRHKVLDLLRSSGRKLNHGAYAVTADHLKATAAENPWHACFAIGLCWGHLAQAEVAFTENVCRAIADLDDDALKVASTYHYERGPDPIAQSVRGARMLFEKVVLPEALPSTLEDLGRAQERWLGRILGPDRPPYIAAWNATAMFMAALFAQPSLAATQKTPVPVLPPGGPIFTGLALLHKAGVLSQPPDGNALDDAGFEPGVLYMNNSLLVELVQGIDDWSLIDVHSGVYMLGTQHPLSAKWA